jgi:hypothetical protein
MAAARTAAKGQKRCQANMAHSENTDGKENQKVGRTSFRRAHPADQTAVERISRKWARLPAGRAGSDPWAIQIR